MTRIDLCLQLEKKSQETDCHTLSCIYIIIIWLDFIFKITSLYFSYFLKIKFLFPIFMQISSMVAICI